MFRPVAAVLLLLVCGCAPALSRAPEPPVLRPYPFESITPVTAGQASLNDLLTRLAPLLAAAAADEAIDRILADPRYAALGIHSVGTEFDAFEGEDRVRRAKPILESVAFELIEMQAFIPTLCRPAFDSGLQPKPGVAIRGINPHPPNTNITSHPFMDLVCDGGLGLRLFWPDARQQMPFTPARVELRIRRPDEEE